MLDIFLILLHLGPEINMENLEYYFFSSIFCLVVLFVFTTLVVGINIYIQFMLKNIYYITYLSIILHGLTFVATKLNSEIVKSWYGEVVIWSEY